jgi:predicted acetyltransferase
LIETLFLPGEFPVLDDGVVSLQLTHTVPADPVTGWVPTYHFAICLPGGEVAGICDLRIGENRNLYYGGHIGYEVYEAYRGHHYAARAVTLLCLLAKQHGFSFLWITCNPENIASRKTCERAGGVLEAVEELPKDNDMYEKGERRKCIYRFWLEDGKKDVQ